MQHQIETITDSSQFAAIFSDYYAGSPTGIKLTGSTIPAEFVGYTEGAALFRVPNIKNLPGECLIIAKKNNRIIYGSMKQMEQKKEQLFIFSPVKFQIISAARKEERHSIPENGQGKKIIFVTNLMSNILIENDMAMQKKKLDKIRDHIIEGLDKAYEQTRVYFCSDGGIDQRMRYFYSQKKPIFIPDFREEGASPDLEQHRLFISNIYATDYSLKNSSFVSEMSVPFLFQMKMAYGYVQINSRNKLGDSAFKNLRQYAVSVDQLFTRNSIFRPSTEKFLVSDVSKKGFSIAFRERKFIRYFKENSTMTLDMILANDKKAGIYTAIRHITTRDNKIINIGFEILEMDALGEVSYEEFLESVK
jgi:hypothetical protein